MPESDPTRSRVRSIADLLLAALLILLTFLLGCFRQIDADIWWHLKTGQEMLRRGEIPRTDWFTFTATDRPWIDLHWLFQIAAAQLYELGGMRLLTLSSATLGAAALSTVLMARRREWPVAWQVAGWLPTVFLLTGRMYVRPEVVTLVCMAAFLTILFHAGERPRPVWLLSLLLPIQIFWVNVQGLFVLGLVLYGVFWLDGLWRHVSKQPGLALLPRTLFGVALVAACLLNPYGVAGLLFPFELFRKMSSSFDAAFYSEHIAELQSMRQFIAVAGLTQFYVMLHFFVLGLGSLSFLLAWSRRRFHLFQLIAFAVFAWFGLQATRNSGQFALVAGTVTAWNLAEWAAARRVEGRESRVESEQGRVEGRGSTVWLSTLDPRLSTLLLLIVSIWAVVSGRYYALAGEGRLFGLSEQPFWHAHDAARFAARPGMPDRMIAFHLGHAAIFEFYKRDEQRTFCDPRLEVASRELLEEYHEIERAIAENRRGWGMLLARRGLEMVLVDHRSGHLLEATLLTDPDWRCVHYDAVASVFVRVERAGAQHPGVDFARWHFETARAAGASTPPRIDSSSPWWPNLQRMGDLPPAREPIRELVLAEALYKVARDLWERGADDGIARTLSLLCLDHARAAARRFSGAAGAWRFMGLAPLLQLDDVLPAREFASAAETERPYSVMLNLARARHALTAAWYGEPSDFVTLSALYGVCGLQNDISHQVSYGRMLLDRRAKSPRERAFVEMVHAEWPARAESVRLDEAEPGVERSQAAIAELEARFREHLSHGRTKAALNEVEPFMASYDDPTRDQYGTLPVSLLERVATVFLETGEPSSARAIVQGRLRGRIPASRFEERIAETYLVEFDYDAAIRYYLNALDLEPDGTNARWGLSRCYLETGDAAAVAREAAVLLDSETLSPGLRREIEWMRDLAVPYAD